LALAAHSNDDVGVLYALSCRGDRVNVPDILYFEVLVHILKQVFPKVGWRAHP